MRGTSIILHLLGSIEDRGTVTYLAIEVHLWRQSPGAESAFRIHSTEPDVGMSVDSRV